MVDTDILYFDITVNGGMTMKKLAIGLLAATTLALGTVASAADVAEATSVDAYTGFDNSTHFTESNSRINEYQTVLIKNSDSEIVYIDEAETTFGEAMRFMLRGSTVAEGTYTAIFGSDIIGSKEVTFTVGRRNVSGTDNKGVSHEATVDTANKMKVADEPALQEEDGTLYKKGFVYLSNGTAFNKAHIVAENGTTYLGSVTISDTTTVVSGESPIAYGIEIYNIPEESKGINLYLGTETTTTSNEGANE